MTFVPSDHEHAPKVAATPARQGRWGRHVLWVLVVSTLLAAVALFASWSMNAHRLQRAQNTSQATAADVRHASQGPAAPIPAQALEPPPK